MNEIKLIDIKEEILSENKPDPENNYHASSVFQVKVFIELSGC